MSESQKKSAGSSAKQPPSPRSSENKTSSKKKTVTSSSRSASCSNKLKQLTVNSTKSSSSRNKPCDRSNKSENSDKTIDLTGESSAKAVRSIDHEAIAEEIAKKDSFVRALQTRVFNQEPNQGITTDRAAIRSTCNTCKLVKPLNQTWDIHNSSPEHISYLLNNCGSYCQVTKTLQRNFIKELKLFCELCGNHYPDIVSYCAHKFETEHQNRVRDLANWRQASKTAGTNLSEWKRVPKIKKVDAKTLSKAVRKSISKKNK